MKHATLYLLIAGLFTGVGVTAEAGNQSTGEQMAVCDGLYGVSKTNCIQDVRAGRFAATSTAASALAKVNDPSKPCEDLYGVTKTNCMQDLKAGRFTATSTAAPTIAKANDPAKPCDGFYGVTKTNCLQDLRWHAGVAPTHMVRSAD
jgi:hypothetical protein